MIHVVMVSKALVDGAYRAKVELLGAEPDIELVLVVPEHWREGDRDVLPAPGGPGYELVTTAVRRPGDYHFHWFPHLGAVFAALQPDVVHMDDEPYNLAAAHALRAAKHAGNPRTVFFAWQNLPRRLPWPVRKLQDSTFAHADGAIAGTSAAAEVLRSRGFTGPLWVVPQFGVDETVFVPGPPPPAGAPLCIGYAGRLVPAKGVDVLLDAVQSLPCPWTLEIAGDGPGRPALEARAAGRPVTFHGWLAGPELVALYQRLDVLVLPSRATPSWEEQFGRVLVEAMACGVACIGAATGEIQEVLGEAGLIFPDGDAAVLRDQLARLAGDADFRRTMATRGRARALERYTMRRVAAETAEAYRTLCGGEGKQITPGAPL